MTQINIDAKGHRFQEAKPASLWSGTVGEAAGVVIGDILYLAGDGLLYKFNGTEDACAAIVGVANDSYAQTATGYYWKLNGIAPGTGTFTAGGELWAKHDGTLCHWAALTPGGTMWSKRMGVALTTANAQIADGEVMLVP